LKCRHGHGHGHAGMQACFSKMTTECVKLNEFAPFKKENLSFNELCTMQKLASKSL
jgi:hypothetical protein